MANIEYKRILSKNGSGAPTIPPSPSHDTGDWIETDIYEGELYIDNDTDKLYTRIGSSIILLTSSASVSALTNPHVPYWDGTAWQNSNMLHEAGGVILGTNKYIRSNVLGKGKIDFGTAGDELNINNNSAAYNVLIKMDAINGETTIKSTDTGSGNYAQLEVGPNFISAGSVDPAGIFVFEIPLIKISAGNLISSIDGISSTIELNDAYLDILGSYGGGNMEIYADSGELAIAHTVKLIFNSAEYNFTQLTPSTIPYIDSSNNLISSSPTVGAPNFYFDSGYGIDSIGTIGSDILNIGATNANVINYGNSSTIHNFLGTAIYELQVNAYVTDKLMTLNYGGAVGSGIGVGYEIQENSIITGYQKTNASRSGWSFKAPANTNYTDLVFSATVPRTKTFQDTTGTIAELADIAALSSVYQLLDPDLTTIAGLTATTDNFMVSVSSAWASRTPAQVRTTLGLVIGTNVQTWDADLDSISALGFSSTSFLKKTAANTWALDTNVYLTTVALDDISDVIISSPSLDQILKYNGSNWVNGSATTINAGAGVDFYHDDTASDISGYQVLNRAPENISEATLTGVANNGRTLIKAYASPVAGLGGTQIDGGEWIFDIFASVDVIGAGLSSVDIDIYKRTSGGTETLLFNVNSGTIGITSVDLYSVSSIQQPFSISSTDRLVIKVYAKTTSILNRTVTFYYGGTTHYSNLSTPLVVRHNDIAGLQGGTSGQYYHLSSAEYSAMVTDSNTKTFTNKTFDTGATGNVFMIGGVSITAVTGSGANVLSNSPTLSNPVVGTQAPNDNSSKAASTAYADAIASYGSYKTIAQAGGGMIAGITANDYPGGGNMATTVSGTSTNTWNGVCIINIRSADYPTINGVAPKTRIRGMVTANHTAPTGNFTLGLFPLVEPASSGGAAVKNFTLGTVIAGSNGGTISTPAADSLNNLVGADFALPADGFYVLCCTTTATIATNSQVFWNAFLQIHNG